MKKIKLPPSRIERKESVEPTVMVGQCVFAARGKVSMIRVSNRPAEKKAVEILVRQIMTSNPATPETLGISSPKSDRRRIVFCSDHYTRNAYLYDSFLYILDDNDGLKLADLVVKDTLDKLSFGPTKIRSILDKVPKVHTLILPIDNNSIQPNSPALAAEFLEKLNEMALRKKVAIIIIYNQWNGMRKPKNGSFIGVAEKHFFSIAKLSYVASPDTFDLESFKSYRGHKFFHITVQFEPDGSLLYERGITVNRVV